MHRNASQETRTPAHSSREYSHLPSWVWELRLFHILSTISHQATWTESAMAKQSLGFSTPSMKLKARYVRQHFMLYPQTPVVSTKAINLLGLKDLTKQGRIVSSLMLPFEPHRRRRGVQQSISRKGLAGHSFIGFTRQKQNNILAGCRCFEVPPPDANIRGYRGEKAYRLLEQDGALMHEAVVNGGDILSVQLCLHGLWKNTRSLRLRVHTGETLQSASGRQKTVWSIQSL